MNKLNKTITIARAIIRIGDAARSANDYSLLGALHEIVEQLSQNGVKDTDVDMDLLLKYVEAMEVLQKLLADEIKLRFSRNYAKDTKFSDLLNQALTRYRNGTIEAAQVIEELINIGQKIRQTAENGAVDGLSEDEVIFYDALVENGSAREVLGDAQLRDIAKVLLEQVRRDATIDWAERKNVQAKLKVNVKKTLAKYGYPPDQQALATDMVLEQAKRYGNEWSQKRAAYDAGGASLLD